MALNQLCNEYNVILQTEQLKTSAKLCKKKLNCVNANKLCVKNVWNLFLAILNSKQQLCSEFSEYGALQTASEQPKTASL